MACAPGVPPQVPGSPSGIRFAHPPFMLGCRHRKQVRSSHPALRSMHSRNSSSGLRFALRHPVRESALHAGMPTPQTPAPRARDRSLAEGSLGKATAEASASACQRQLPSCQKAAAKPRALGRPPRAVSELLPLAWTPSPSGLHLLLESAAPPHPKARERK